MYVRHLCHAQSLSQPPRSCLNLMLRASHTVQFLTSHLGRYRQPPTLPISPHIVSRRCPSSPACPLTALLAPNAFTGPLYCAITSGHDAHTGTRRHPASTQPPPAPVYPNAASKKRRADRSLTQGRASQSPVASTSLAAWSSVPICVKVSPHSSYSFGRSSLMPLPILTLASPSSAQQHPWWQER